MRTSSQFSAIFALASLALGSVLAQPIDDHSHPQPHPQPHPHPHPKVKCTNYTIIETRGTYEPQGPSIGFKTMNQNVLSTYPGGSEYDVVYPASTDQNSTLATIDIIQKVHSLVDADARHCIFIEGYSQGASATLNAMPNITGKYFDAIKTVILLGDPRHKPGLPCNIDEVGGKTTVDAVGLAYNETGQVHVLPTWQPKTLDICKTGDGVCDSKHGKGITMQHLSYGFNPKTQAIGEKAMAAFL